MAITRASESMCKSSFTQSNLNCQVAGCTALKYSRAVKPIPKPGVCVKPFLLHHSSRRKPRRSQRALTVSAPFRQRHVQRLIVSHLLPRPVQTDPELSFARQLCYVQTLADEAAHQTFDTIEPWPQRPRACCAATPEAEQAVCR